MGFLSRLLGTRADPREAVRPLWHRTVELAREPAYYAECGVADTVEGRFDMVATILAIVILRLERDPALTPASAHLTELFVEDMDGQLRQIGVGDLVVGKKMGRLVSGLGGRLGALREARGAPEAMAGVVERNIRMTEDGNPRCVAARLAALAERLDTVPAEALLAGEIA